ncbi:prepilin peptidase [Pararhodobacter sp. CCB-MM2]|uniref:A24 family peptidase n=1 Tax=Pararhodobacter sp. CCB-MM2 TaxID=1786003 RepID=UPI000830CC21|nr:prepilin peptidase [Pararhodobacter sp. CCB-MM2]MCA2013080.1 prepilin peptidase [Cereibacter sphaeroides]
MLTQSAHAAVWLLIFATPICLYVAWSDLKAMRIPNLAVLALIIVYAIVGALTLPLGEWGWSWLHFLVVLVIGFVLSLSGTFGAGDAKFAAAMAPFVALGDLRLFLVLLSAVTLAAFVVHRVMRAIPAIRRATPDWASWQRKEFPFGMALAPALIFYLVLASIYGR